MDQNHFTDSYLIAGIQSRSDEVFNYLRSQCYDVVQMIVTTNSGSIQDAEDVYLEGVIGLIDFLDKKKKVEVNCKVTTLFVSICKNQWSQIISKRKTFKYYGYSTVEESYSEELEDTMDKEVFDNIVWSSFSQLKKDCKIILRGYLKGMKVRDIAGLLDLSPAYVKKKKHYCHKYLIQLISEHPEYENLKKSGELHVI